MASCSISWGFAIEEIYNMCKIVKKENSKNSKRGEEYGDKKGET
jgi:hypothetical protein